MLGIGFLTLDPVTDATGRSSATPTATRNTRACAPSPATTPTIRTSTACGNGSPWLAGDRKFTVLARDVIFMKALRNTVLFVAVVAPVQAILALGLALLINVPLRGINIYRTIFFMPVVISMVVVSMLWRFIYDGQNGLLNTLFGLFSFGAFQPVDWLGNTSTALPAIMAMSIWQGVGFHMVIWLAGLQTIPNALYEAARIEGATPLAVVPLRHLAGPQEHGDPGDGDHHHAGLYALSPDPGDDPGRAGRFHPEPGLPDGGARLRETGHLRRLGDLGVSVPVRAVDLAVAALPDPGEETMSGERLVAVALRYLLLCWIALIFVFPVVFMAVSSLKPDLQAGDSASLRAFLPVGDISLENYFAAFERAPIAAFRSELGLRHRRDAGPVAVPLFHGRVLLRVPELEGPRRALAVILATFILPFETIAVPLLMIVNNLPWIGLGGVSGRLAQQLSRPDHPLDRRRADDLPVRPVLQGPAQGPGGGGPGGRREAGSRSTHG